VLFAITETIKNIKNAEISYNIENYTFTARELFTYKQNGTKCTEVAETETHRTCVLALELDAAKSVYFGHYNATVVGCKSCAFYYPLQFERPNSSLALSVGLAIVALILVIFLGFVAFYLKSKMTSQQTRANENNQGKVFTIAMRHILC